MNPARTTARQCEQCNVIYELPLCRMKRRPYCSTPCRIAARLARKEARKRICGVCGHAFYPRPQQIRVGQGKYCSVVCRRYHLLGHKQTPEHLANRLASWSANPNKRILRGSENGKFQGGYRVCYERRLKDGRIARNNKKYRTANPAKVRDWEQQRHGLKTGKLPKGTVARLHTLQRGYCAACKRRLNGRYHVDHVMPLTKGGRHVSGNVQLLCPTCNTRKSNKLPERFMREMGFLL